MKSRRSLPRWDSALGPNSMRCQPVTAARNMTREREGTVRHRKNGRQLGRKTKHRRALFRSLVTSLLDQERIETTEAKAKEIRGFAERMITLGKQGDLPARRDRKSTRLNSSHVAISYAVFCL